MGLISWIGPKPSMCICGVLTRIILLFDPLKDDAKQTWLQEDARLFLQIRNSIESEVISLISHCEFVKELMHYLQFLYSARGNVSRVYDVCKAFYHLEKLERTS